LRRWRISGPLAQHELADRLDINRSHLVGYLDHLEQRGLVARDRDPDDRRRQRVALTAAGRALLRDLGPVAERSQSEFLDALSRSERATLVSLLRRVLDANDEARLAEGRQDRSAFLVREHARPAPSQLCLIQAEGLARAARSIVR
jgi:DNA-binding MarR family transcriptional regulator